MLIIGACAVVFTAQAQTSYPRHQLGVGFYGGPQSKPRAEHLYGPVSDVHAQKCNTIGAALSYKYAVGESKASFFGALGEINFTMPSIAVHSEPQILSDGTILPGFDQVGNWGLLGSVRQWTLLYGRRWPLGHGWFEGYVGAGIVEMSLTVAIKPLFVDTNYYGIVYLYYADIAQVAPTFRLGGDLYLPTGERGALKFGLVGLWTGQYVTGEYMIWEKTSAESYGTFTGSLSYVGLQLGYAWTLGKDGVHKKE